MLNQFSIYLAWGVSLFSSLASLYFSEILKYPPCSLCWYQRIFMYPLALIIPVGILSSDRFVARYVTVLSLIGLVIAVYHSLIYHNLIQEAFTVCTADLSCKTKQLELFGFLSIPLMSLLSFLIIFLLAIRGLNHEKRA